MQGSANHKCPANRELFSDTFFRGGATPPGRVASSGESGEGESPGRMERDFSTGIRDGDYRPSQAELQEQEQIDGGAHGVGAAMEVAYPVELFDGEGKAG